MEDTKRLKVSSKLSFPRCVAESLSVCFDPFVTRGAPKLSSGRLVPVGSRNIQGSGSGRKR